MSWETHWASWLPPEPTLRLTALVALALLLATLAVLLQVLLVSTWATRERRAREAFNRQWRPELAKASIDERGFPELAPPRDDRRRLWWLMLWNRLQRQLRGDATARLNRLIRLLGLETHCLRLLRRRGVRNRLVALETLRHLGEREHWDAVEPLCRARNPFVAIAAAHALIAMDAPAAMRYLLPLAIARTDWRGQRLLALGRHAGRHAVTPPLLEALQAADSTILPRLVSLLPCADPARVAPWTREHALHDRDPRHRQAALQALAELGDPRDRALLVQAFADEDPSVRLAAVSALRRQARGEDVEVLLPLLADRSWWVRREAADTLVALPRVDEAALHALLPRVQDRYGREELERALAERAARSAS